MISEKAVEAVARKVAGQYMVDDGYGETSRAPAEAGAMWLNFRKAATVALEAALSLHDAPVECKQEAVAIPPGWKLVPDEPTDAMLEFALDASGQRVAPFTAERESGVALECDLSEEDAASINEQMKAAHCEAYCAMLAVAPRPLIAEQNPTEHEKP